MITLKEKVHNLETIIQKKNFSSEHKLILLKEIERLKQELVKQEGYK